MLFDSITTLLKSDFPGRVRVVIDQKVNETIRGELDPKYKDVLKRVEFNVVSLPDLNGKELIPHSNKIRALQARALLREIQRRVAEVKRSNKRLAKELAEWVQAAMDASPPEVQQTLAAV